MSYIQPAVSINTTSIFLAAASLIASLAILAGSSLYPQSKTGISKQRPWVFNYSTAPERKLSQAAKETENPFVLNKYAIFAKFVDLPTPLTPIKTITNGLPSSFLCKAIANKSILFFGVSTEIRTSWSAFFTSFHVEVSNSGFVCKSRCKRLSHILLAMDSATFFFERSSQKESITGRRTS